MNFFSFIFAYWRSEEKIKAWSFVLALVMCSVIEILSDLRINAWLNTFYTALQTKHFFVIFPLLLEYFILFGLSISALTLGFYLSSTLANHWRRWLTHVYLQQWLFHAAYLRMERDGNVDNPDQRVAEDIDTMTCVATTFFFGGITAVLKVLLFSRVLWHLSSVFLVNIMGKFIEIQGYLFWAALLYTAVGTLIVIMLGRTLSKLNYQYEQAKAFFRFELVRTREHAENIALNKEETQLLKTLMQLFVPVFEQFKTILSVSTRVFLYRNVHNNAAMMLGLALGAPAYLVGRFTFGHLMQIPGAFSAVVSSVSYFLNQYTEVATGLAATRRLIEMDRATRII